MQPGPNEVHLWFVSPDEITNPLLIDAYRALLTEEEEARRVRYKVEHARQEFLVGRALVRTTLSRYGDIAPEAWRFQMNEHGRPDLEPAQRGEPELLFNLSHTRGLVVCAVVRGQDVGVDVEDTRRMTDGVAIADRFFSEAEVGDLHRLPAHHQPDRFYDYWTLKEAYIKARGMGLALPLGGFSYHLLQPPPPRISFEPAHIHDTPEAWQFSLFSPTEHHRAALAVKRGEGAPAMKVTLRWVVPLTGEEKGLQPKGEFWL